MIILSIVVIAGLFILNLIFGMYFGFGIRHYWFFEALHFLAGFFIAMFLLEFTKSYQTIFLILVIVSFIWELSEYLLFKLSTLSKLFKKTFNFKPEYKLDDTILDLTLNFAGATTFILMARQFLSF